MTFERDLQRTLLAFAAIEPEDLDRGERSAALRVAHWVDARLNRQTISNGEAGKTFLEPSRVARAFGCDCEKCSELPERTWLGDPVPVNLRTMSQRFRDER